MSGRVLPSFHSHWLAGWRAAFVLAVSPLAVGSGAIDVCAKVKKERLRVREGSRGMWLLVIAASVR